MPNTKLPTNEEIMQFQSRALYADVWHACTNCGQWGVLPGVQPLQEGCRRYAALPPPKTLVLGCGDWEGVIPF